MLHARAAESTPIFGTRETHSETDRQNVNYSFYPDVAIETCMDAGSGLMFLACVAIEKRRNQSNSSTLDVVMAALPSILRDTDILRVSKDTQQTNVII